MFEQAKLGAQAEVQHAAGIAMVTVKVTVSSASPVAEETLCVMVAEGSTISNLTVLVRDASWFVAELQVSPQTCSTTLIVKRNECHR